MEGVFQSLTPEVGDKFDAGKCFKLSSEEQRNAEGWAKVQLWDASKPQELGQERVIKLSPEEQQKAQEWAKVQLWEKPEIKQSGDTGKPLSLEEQRARGWEKVQLWGANKPQTPEFKDVDLSDPKEKRGERTKNDQDVLKENEHPDNHIGESDKTVDQTDNQQNKPGILAGFRQKVKDIFRSKSDPTQGPKEFTPLDDAYVEEPVVKEQDKDKTLKKEGDKEQTTQ
jgi:hypothetical protein